VGMRNFLSTARFLSLQLGDDTHSSSLVPPAVLIVQHDHQAGRDDGLLLET